MDIQPAEEVLYTQVSPSAPLLVPLGQVSLVHDATAVRSTPVKTAPVRLLSTICAPARLAPVKLAPERLASLKLE